MELSGRDAIETGGSMKITTILANWRPARYLAERNANHSVAPSAIDRTSWSRPVELTYPTPRQREHNDFLGLAVRRNGKENPIIRMFDYRQSPMMVVTHHISFCIIFPPYFCLLYITLPLPQFATKCPVTSHCAFPLSSHTLRLVT